MINHFIKTLALAVAFCLAASAAPKMSKDLDKLDSKKNADVIVQFKQTPGAAQHQKVTNNGGTLKKLNVVKAGVRAPARRWIIRVIMTNISSPEAINIAIYGDK